MVFINPWTQSHSGSLYIAYLAGLIKFLDALYILGLSILIPFGQMLESLMNISFSGISN